MQPTELLDLLQQAGRDPSRLIFEDELTGIHNRRFLHSYLEHKVHWTEGTDYPFSLLILDLDHFKDVNDTHGHAAGDQLLAWVASVLREVAGDTGLPVRSGGDEFMLLLPRTDRAGAQEAAARVLKQMRERPFRLRDAGMTLPVTLSIGSATAPADATASRELLQAADTALYHAKQSGRNQAASAAEVDPRKVFPRTALNRLLASGIVGRDAELRVVSEALLALSRGQSQFLIFDGAAGMGKTTLLGTIERNISGAEGFAIARVAGDQQEGFRPYHLATRILVALLSQRGDKGATVVQSLNAEEVAHLSRIVPQVAEGAAPVLEGDESARRQRTFAALVRFLPLVVDGRPLVLLIDDLQFADEATLLLLRALLQSQNLGLLVCGAALEHLAVPHEAEASPLERFCLARGQEVGIRRLKLSALNAQHIGAYLRSVFPNLRMPDGFDAELARITEGNPLFLGEIIRKLVADRKVKLVGRDWVIERLEAGYLPQSLDDIVKEKIAALDAETRGLLEQASLFGEGVALSTLSGSAELDENRVLEFLDRAEALGLVSVDFQRNDEVMRFLGKRVLEISYGGMDERRRQALHEHVGTYQEALSQQRALPSASLLAYHFKRSANQEKARRYEQAQRGYAQTVFDPEEAARYKIEEVEEESAAGRLAPESFALVPNVLRAFVTGVRSLQLYPPESKTIPQAIEHLRQALQEILETNAWLHLSQDRHLLLANGQRVELSESRALTSSFLDVLDRFELQGLTFERGVTDAELRALLTTLAGATPPTILPGFWKRTATEQGLTRVKPHQVRYSKTVQVRAARLLDQEEELKPDELALIPRILRFLQTAAKTARLYPPDAEPVIHAVDQLHAALRDLLRNRPSLTLAGVEHALLANGVRVDTTGYEAVASGVVDMLAAAGLESLTVYADVQVPEVRAFLSGLRDHPPAGAAKRFWADFVRREGITGFGFNQRHYAVTAVQGLLREMAPGEAATEADTDAAELERLSAEPLEALRQALPRFGKELLVKGEHALVRGLLRRLFEGFRDQDPVQRIRTLQACHTLFDRLVFGLQHKYAELAAGFLLPALAGETEPSVLGELADLLYAMAGNAVQLADHQLAGRILLELRTRQQQLRDAGDREAASAAPALNGRLDATALRLLSEDVRSGRADYQERAAQVLGVLGPTGLPVLLDVLKQESGFRERQLAARLVAEAGATGAAQIKRALATEVVVDQRARLLEVIDTVTRDLRDEFQQCLFDDSPKIRRAAFQLFERLRQDDLIDVILPFAQHWDPWVVRAAIRALTTFHTPAAVRALASILRVTKESSTALLCCQALGASDDAAAIDALARVLRARRFGLWGRRWRSEVRATAATALKQIPDPRAAAVLALYAQDRDAAVRRVAQDVKPSAAASPASSSSSVASGPARAPSTPPV